MRENSQFLFFLFACFFDFVFFFICSFMFFLLFLLFLPSAVLVVSFPLFSLSSSPGGRLRPGEDEILGLKRKLSKRLAAAQEELRPEWEVSDLISQWWRPHFEPLMYPYNPPHISRPKEYKKIFLVLLQEAAQFAVPSNLKLLAVPLFELYDNPGRYGPTIATLAQALSRFTFHCIPPPMTEGEAAEAAAQAAQQQQQPMDEEQQPAEQDQQTVKQEGEQSAAAAADSEQPTS